jgi:signal transduction histidine kinase
MRRETHNVAPVTPLPVPRRWLAALLGAAFLADVLLAASVGGGGAVALPGAVVMLACAYLAAGRPAVAAFAGAAALLASAAVARVAGAPMVGIAIPNILLSEVVAGAALTVLVVWRGRPSVAVAATTTLVAACLTAMLIRDPPPNLPISARPDPEPLVPGLVLLVFCVATGVYLRQLTQDRIDRELRALISRQWPLAAVLAVLFLVDLSGHFRQALGHPMFTPFSADPVLITQGSMIPLAGSAVAAGCAVLAPRAPVRCALIGAAAIGVPAVSLESVGLPFTQVAASLALIGFLARYAAAGPAAGGIAALVAVNLLVLLPQGILSGEDLVAVAFLPLVLVITGLYFRSRDRERHQTARSAVTGARQAERMALARELHDVVAHHVTGMVVQAQAARLVAEDEPGAATRALEKIEHSGTEALAAMRMLVGSMRGARPAGDATAAEQATSDLAADIRTLVDRFPGPPVHLDLDLPDTLPSELGRSVLRLVQESLTNVSKHAPDATAVHVTIAVTEGALHVRIDNDGNTRRGTPAGGSGGYGLIGMRERVELLGGRFAAGHHADVGWRVKAWLPLTKEGR